MRKPVNPSCLVAVLLLSTLAGCLEVPEPPEVREPQCEPRSTTEPGRLSIEATADNYGVMPPCEAIVTFYIPGTAPLAAIEAEAKLTDPNGATMGPERLEFDLHGPKGGMLYREVKLAPAEGGICRETTLDLELLACRDGNGTPIECPEVRVRRSYSLSKVTAFGPELDVCFDD